VTNSIYNLIGGVARVLIGILSVPMMIRALGTSSYGLYAIANSFIAFATLSEMSVVTVTTIFVSKSIGEDFSKEYKKTLRACFWATLGLAIVFTCLLFIIIPHVDLIFSSFNEKQIRDLQETLVAGTILVFIRTVQQFFNGLEQAHQNYDLLNKINTLFYLFIFGGSVVTAILFGNLLIVFTWQCFVSSIFVIVHYIYCLKKGFIEHISDIIQWPGKNIYPILKYCIKVWPGTLGGLLFSQGDRIVVGKLLGYEAVGIYAGLTSVASQINLVSALPVQPLMAYVGTLTKTDNYINDKNYENIINIVFRSTSLSVLIAIGTGLTLTCLAPEIVYFLLGSIPEGTISVILLLKLLAIIYSTYSLNATGYYILFAIRKEGLNTIVSLVSSAITITLIYYLTYQFGLLGAIVGNVGFVITLILLVIAYKKLLVKKEFLIRVYVIPLSLLGMAFLININVVYLGWRIIIFVSSSLTLLYVLWPYIGTLISKSFIKLLEGIGLASKVFK
jgi:O-antigen/teichoic acid export membrane protein